MRITNSLPGLSVHKISTTDFRLLEVFSTIVECKGISPAQAELDLSLSSISNYLSTLETRLGVKLCNRGRRGFSLTDEGRAIYDQTQHLFSAADAFTSAINGLKGRLSGTLKIGMADCMASDSVFPLSKAISWFLRRENDVEIFISTHSPDEMMRATFNGKLDLCIGLFGNKVEGLVFEPLYLENQSIYCHKNHPLFTKKNIVKDELVEHKFSNIGYLKSYDLERIGSKLANGTVEMIEAQAVMIQSGEYLGVLPQHYAQQWVEKGEMRAILPDILDFSVVISLATRSHGPKKPAANAFIIDLCKVCKDMIQAGDMRPYDPTASKMEDILP